jgi:hypothetical protein
MADSTDLKLSLDNKYFLGFADISIEQLERHPSQRPLTIDFVNKLANDLKGNSPRFDKQLSVIPKTPLSQADMDLLCNSSIAVTLSKEYEYWVIDGQHRMSALRRLQESSFISEDAFYRWPCRIYSPGKFSVMDISH